MAVGDAVTSMSQKLFSGAGLWAAIVLLSVVYQSCALGYFYWSRMMQAESAPGDSGAWTFEGAILAAGLLFSLGLGLGRGFYGLWLRAGLRAVGVEIN